MACVVPVGEGTGAAWPPSSAGRALRGVGGLGWMQPKPLRAWKVKRKALGCLARPFLGVPLARQTEAFMLPLPRPQTWGPGPALATQHLLKEKPWFSWCKASTAARSRDVTEAQPGEDSGRPGRGRCPAAARAGAPGPCRTNTCSGLEGGEHFTVGSARLSRESHAGEAPGRLWALVSEPDPRPRGVGAMGARGERLGLWAAPWPRRGHTARVSPS